MARNVFGNGASLYRVIEDAPIAHLKAFLLQQDSNFRQVHDVVDVVVSTVEEEESLRKHMMNALNRLPRDQAEPVEVECRRILDLVEAKGPTSLRTLVERQLSNEECEEFEDQPGNLARSIWAHVHHRRVFDDAVSFNAIRSWRNAGRLFAAFNVDLGGKGSQFSSVEIDTEKLGKAIGKKLKTTRPLSISLIDLPQVPEYLPAVLVIVRFAGPQSSVATHGERGERRLLYFLPQDEAVLIYTPADERIEVAAARATTRNAVAECFAVETLGHDVSAKPLTSAIYDTHRFLTSVELPLPDISGFFVVSAKVLEIELRIENWQSRLSLKTGGGLNMSTLIHGYLDPGNVMRRALGVSRVLIAVGYQLPSDEAVRILELLISDGNSCSLNLERDPTIRNYGRKLLEAWGILRAFRDLDEKEASDLIPVMAELWELDQRVQKGGYFSERGIPIKPLEDATVIRRKEIEPVLILEEQDDEVEWPTILDRTIYTVDHDWLQERLIIALKAIIDVPVVDELLGGLVGLGHMHVDDREVPCYLARGLNQIKTFSLIDERLRARAGAGPGIVFTGKVGGPRLIGANVVVPLVSSAEGSLNIAADRDGIASAFRNGRSLALSARTLELVEEPGQTAARLHVPGRDPLDIFGEHPVRAFRLLVDAVRRGRLGVKTSDLLGHSSASSLEQMIGARRWPVVAPYIDNVERGWWRLAGT